VRACQCGPPTHIYSYSSRGAEGHGTFMVEFFDGDGDDDDDENDDDDLCV